MSENEFASKLLASVVALIFGEGNDWQNLMLSMNSTDIPYRGAQRILWRMLAALLRPVGALTCEIILVRDLTQTLPLISAAVEMTIKTATEADLGWVVKLYRDEPYLFIGPEGASGASQDEQQELVAKPDDQRAIEAYRNRFRRGEKCFVAFVGAQVAHVNWLCLSWGEEAVPGHPIILQPGEAYTTDALTLEPFRGMNIHALVLGQMLHAAQSMGCQRVYTATSIDRQASFGAFRQLGWQVYGQLLCFVPKCGGRARLIKLSGSIEPLLRSPRT